jgi:hypothetical protein
MTNGLLSSMSEADDATLARAAAAGDRVAFAEIYDRYANRLHDFCVGPVRDSPLRGALPNPRSQA